MRAKARSEEEKGGSSGETVIDPDRRSPYQGTEGARELVDVELAVAVGVEVGKDLLHVPLLVAGDRLLPEGLVKEPAQVDLGVDLVAQRLRHGGVELLHRHEPVAVDVKGLAAGAGRSRPHVREGWGERLAAPIREGACRSYSSSKVAAVHAMRAGCGQRRRPRRPRFKLQPSTQGWVAAARARKWRSRRPFSGSRARASPPRHAQHGLVHIRLLAGALREPDGAEGARDLIDVKLAVAIGIELGKESLHVVLALAALIGQDALGQAVVRDLARLPTRGGGSSSRCTATHRALLVRRGVWRLRIRALWWNRRRRRHAAFAFNPQAAVATESTAKKTTCGN